MTRLTGSASEVSMTPDNWDFDEDPDDLGNHEPLSNQGALQRSQTWGARVSSLNPLLTQDEIDLHRQSIQRKPLPVSISPPETPPPPPYESREGSPRSKPVGLGLADVPEDVSEDGTLDLLDTIGAFPDPSGPFDTSDFSFSAATNETPDMIAPVPPSPPSALDTPMASVRMPTPPPLPPPSSSLTARKGSHSESESESHGPGKLQKARPPKSVRQNAKVTEPTPNVRPRISTSPAPVTRGRTSIAVQVPTSLQSPSGLTPTLAVQDGSPSPSRGRIRRSWLPGGGRSRSNSTEVSGLPNAEAWVMSEETMADYNTSLLKNAEKVPELWNENGNVLVYLYPRASVCGPSFKVPEFVVGTSYVFNELIHTADVNEGIRNRARSFGGRDSLSVNDATWIGSPPPDATFHDNPGALHLYLPVAPPTASAQLTAPGEGAQAELDRLVAIRNLFAFLTGQPLVATKTRPTRFHAFLEISSLLQEFGFSSADGSTFGEAVELSFGFYSEQLALSDCRNSREKTVQALILGERMRHVELYNEAFAHAAGKYSAILDLRLPLFNEVSGVTRERLERAHIDLISRQHSVNEHLEQFEFPSLFAGIANSTSIPELKQVRFKNWRTSFNKVRQFVMSYYKGAFGSWPPKANSKKNPFAESGLNRQVLKVLYSDMCALYDLLVDRKSLTSRVMDEVPAISDAPSKMTTSALRNMLSEFDRSRPPVLPPIPFDLPQLPTMTSIHETFDALSPKDQNRFEKKIKEHELILILNKAYNYDTNTIKLPFLDQFKDFEIREGRGKMGSDLVDQRIGCWLFLYAVLQSLPMLVVDAPGVKHTEGVEYFLCEPPMGNLPWLDDQQVRKMWYEVTGGGGLVELSTDAVMFSVEATYHRSHCWLAAKQWEGLDGASDVAGGPPAPSEPFMSPLEPPRPIFPDAGEMLQSPGSPLSGAAAPGPGTPSPPPGGVQPSLRPRTLSPGGRSNIRRSSIAMGLEPVPMPSDSHFRSSSVGPRPPSSLIGARSASSGNLVAMNIPASATSGSLLGTNMAARSSSGNLMHMGGGGGGGGRRVSPPGQVKQSAAATSGATFDDILGHPDPKPATSKKKGFFF